MVELKVIKQLLDAGISLQRARRAVECLRGDLGADLASANLVLVGTDSVLARSDGEVVDLLKGGQGVFNIVPLSGVLEELDAAILADRRGTPPDARPSATAGDCRPGGPRLTVTAAPRPGRSGDGRVFAHDSERQLRRAPRLLRRALGVRAGRVRPRVGPRRSPRPAFRPDFFLPEHGCFVELTTLNQRLVTRKNAKVRRLRELHPGIEVKLLYQRDYLALLAKYGLPETLFARRLG